MNLTQFSKEESIGRIGELAGEALFLTTMT